ncbi:hypothetical protein C8J56DRAFT_493715 [Mycena floridula]|nr:hypothetical protein C8J56DRAFT_493715 [Mycena floridula]
MSRIELAKIPALTFYRDELTKARRTSAIPQLECVGGGACKRYTPEVVRCESLGGTGTEVDWKCSADLPDGLRFGRVEVSCEGWNKAGDPFVLKGSCGLRYRLVGVPSGLRSDDSLPHKEFDPFSTVFTVIWVAVLLFILYSFLKSCFSTDLPRVPRDADPRQNYYPGSGWFPGGRPDEGSSDPPPPYSKNQQTPGEQARGGWQPGFFTGAALGAIGTHLFNNNRREQAQPRRAWDWERSRTTAPPPGASPGFWGTGRTSSPRTDRGEGSSSNLRSSYAFGGSSVR